MALAEAVAYAGTAEPPNRSSGLPGPGDTVIQHEPKPAQTVDTG
jgi:hypothetical protein